MNAGILVVSPNLIEKTIEESIWSSHLDTENAALTAHWETVQKGIAKLNFNSCRRFITGRIFFHFFEFWGRVDGLHIHLRMKNIRSFQVYEENS